MDFLRCYGLKVKFLMSLVAAVGISFYVAPSMSCSALLNFGFVRGVFAKFCAA